MSKAPIRDRHIGTPESAREAAAGETIVVERRGRPVAELGPLTAWPLVTEDVKTLIFESMRDRWEHMQQLSESAELVEQDRDL